MKNSEEVKDETKKVAVRKSTKKEKEQNVESTEQKEKGKEEGISLKTNSFDNLNSLKIEMQKEEYAERVPLTTEQILEKTLFRMEKLQRQNDVIMREVFNMIPDSEVSNIKPTVLKVFRGKKLYFTTAEAKFKFAGKVFFICSHKEAVGDGVTQFIESLDVLSSTNKVLRVPKKS